MPSVKTLLLNLYGGPGVGKSTTCAGVFSELKLRGVNCEMAPEWAKEQVWEDSGHILDNQLYVFGKQFHRVWRLLGKVDIVVSDSPLLNSILYYKDENPHFPQMVVFEHKRLQNLNVLLERQKAYNPSGRLQTESAAKALDRKIANILDFVDEPYIPIPANKESILDIADLAIWSFEELNSK